MLGKTLISLAALASFPLGKLWKSICARQFCLRHASPGGAVGTRVCQRMRGLTFIKCACRILVDSQFTNPHQSRCARQLPLGEALDTNLRSPALSAARKQPHGKLSIIMAARCDQLFPASKLIKAMRFVRLQTCSSVSVDVTIIQSAARHHSS